MSDTRVYLLNSRVEFIEIRLLMISLRIVQICYISVGALLLLIAENGRPLSSA